MIELQNVLANNYYAAYYDIDNYPTIIKTTRDGGFWSCTGMRRDNKESEYSFYTNNSFGCSKDIRKATPEEKHWLDCCIKKGNIVSFKEAMSSYIPNSKLEKDPALAEILIKLLKL